jgi:hypothetical protein
MCGGSVRLTGRVSSGPGKQRGEAGKMLSGMSALHGSPAPPYVHNQNNVGISSWKASKGARWA